MNSEGKGKGISKTQCNGYKILVRKSKTAFSTTWAAVIRKKSFLFFSFLFFFTLNYRTSPPPFLPHLPVRKQMMCQEWESRSL